jgi:hypothetical protein
MEGNSNTPLHSTLDPGDAATKEFFRTCNVLPFSCTHLALSTKAR